MQQDLQNENSAPGASSKPAKSVKIRLRGGVLLLALLAIWAVALTLKANPTGTGTHRQLGMGTCEFLAETGYPCPGCGVTTSFTAAAHLDFWHSIQAQIFGLLAFLTLLVLAGFSLAELVTARSQFGKLTPRFWWLYIAVGCLLAGWLIKVFAGMSSGKYPMH